ncbi:hypothetical protein AB4501_25215, partial [Vibrio sp. 10N.222.55.E8]
MSVDFDSVESTGEGIPEQNSELDSQDVQPESLYASPLGESEFTVEGDFSAQSSPFDVAEEQSDEQGSDLEFEQTQDELTNAALTNESFESFSSQEEHSEPEQLTAQS